MSEIKLDQELANQISPRERQVIDLMAEGKTNSEIAGALSITIDTVEAHRRNIFKKTGSRNAAHLFTKLFRGGIL